MCSSLADRLSRDEDPSLSADLRPHSAIARLSPRAGWLTGVRCSNYVDAVGRKPVGRKGTTHIRMKATPSRGKGSPREHRLLDLGDAAPNLRRRPSRAGPRLSPDTWAARSVSAPTVPKGLADQEQQPWSFPGGSPSRSPLPGLFSAEISDLSSAIRTSNVRSKVPRRSTEQVGAPTKPRPQRCLWVLIPPLLPAGARGRHGVVQVSVWPRRSYPAPSVVASWRRHAACSGRSDLFFATDRPSQDEAIAICRGCEVPSRVPGRGDRRGGRARTPALVRGAGRGACCRPGEGPATDRPTTIAGRLIDAYRPCPP
jgi:hypothetical protein